MKKTYRSNRGVPIDMDSLRLKNEQAVAMGNMKVNARGDQLGKGGEVVATAKERVAPYYKDNPKAEKKVSLKAPLTNDENSKIDNPEKVVKEQRADKAKATPKKKEVELDDKSIVITDTEPKE